MSRGKRNQYTWQRRSSVCATAVLLVAGLFVASTVPTELGSAEESAEESVEEPAASDALFGNDNGGLQASATWQIPTYEKIRDQTLQLAAEQDLGELQLARVEAFWSDDTIAADQLGMLWRFIETLPLIYPETADICRRVLDERIDQSLASAEGIDESVLPAVAKNNLRLGFARALVRNALYDEALTQLEQIEPVDVVDPATLLFFRSLCYRTLLQRDECLETVELLLENESLIPARYREIGKLVSVDIDPLKVDSLDEIARLMEDIRRRQDLSRSGKRVIQQEDDVIAKLDKIIEDLQKQAQQQQMATGQAGPSSSSPMEDSMPGGGRGDGNVDRKPQIDGGKWGDLPPREREAAMADLVKDLPPHYRQVIEEYFKKLASSE